MQNSLQDCILNHFQFDYDTDAVYVRLHMDIYTFLCGIWRSPAATRCHSINEIGASMIYFKAVGLHMDKIYDYVDLLTIAGFYAILLNLLI